MTSTAIVTTEDMGSGFTARNDIIVTIQATPVDLGMIHCRRIHRHPRTGRLLMAGLTAVGTIDMRGTFTAGLNAVMAKDTVIGKSTMIHHHRQPTCGAMTGIALQRGGQMGSRFTEGHHVIMTTGAGTQHLPVIHRARQNRQPRCRPR